MNPAAPSQLIVPFRRARPVVATALAIAACLLASSTRAQEQPPTPHARPMSAAPKRTILTTPPGALLTLDGGSEVSGISPLDIEPQWTGKYSVSVEAAGFATARGALYLPEVASSPTLRSEPPGLSPGLFLRSLNFPGVPALLSHHRARGVALLLTGGGGLIAVLRDQLEYRSKLKKTDAESQYSALNFRYARGRWELYTVSVWGLSALDYMIRSRIDLLEASPTRVRVSAPRLTRVGVMWRSVLVPGAGQDYANRQGRGLFWLGTTLLSGAGYFIADESHHRIVSKLFRARDLLATAGPGEVAARQADVDHFTSLEETSRQLIDGLAIGTLGLYVANVFDAGIVRIGGSTANRKVSLSAPVGPRRAAVALTYRF